MIDFSQYHIHEVLPGIWCIPIPMTDNPLKELNSYVIKADDPNERSLVIDTGFHWDECYNGMIDGLKRIGIERNNIDILVTHLHGDHVGNAPFIAAEDSKVYISEIDRGYILDENGTVNYLDVLYKKAERLLEEGVSKKMYDEMIHATFEGDMKIHGTYNRYTGLNEGDELKYGGYTLKAVYTPGHTPGHMCFDIVGTGAMILGDHVLFDVTPNIVDWPDKEDALGDYLNSLDKINMYDVKIPLPAHRFPGDFHERVEHLKKHHFARLSECYGIIDSLGDAYAYEIAGKMKWRIRSDTWETFPSIQRWFAMGECFAHLDYLKKRDYITRYSDDKGRFFYRTNKEKPFIE